MQDVDIGREGQAAGDEKGTEDADDQEETGDLEEAAATRGQRILQFDVAELTVRLWIRRDRPLTERHLRRLLPWV